MSLKSNAKNNWSLVIFIAAFITNIIVGGFHYTTGIFYVSMLEHFEMSYSVTSWIGSMVGAVPLLIGPVSSWIIESYSCRSCMLAAALCLAVGYIVSTFAQSLWTVLLGYGVFASTGMGLGYSASIVIISEYFTEEEAPAVTSYALCGVGVGLFTLVCTKVAGIGIVYCMHKTYILEYIMEFFGWRLTYLACAAVSLQVAVLGSLYFPFKNREMGSLESESTNLNDITKSNIVSYNSCDKTILINTSVNEGCSNYDKRIELKDRSMDKKLDQNVKQNVEKNENYSIYRDKNLWLLNLVSLMMQLATLTMCTLYKDFMIFNGYSQYTAIGLSLVGVGDVFGRLATGFLSNCKNMNMLVLYSLSGIATSIVFLLFLIPSNGIIQMGFSTIFGVLFGAQNVYICILPAEIFGSDNLALVLGQNFFWAGIGVLFGAPMAGAMLDMSRDYLPVMLFLSTVSLAGGLLMLLVNHLHNKHLLKKQTLF